MSLHTHMQIAVHKKQQTIYVKSCTKHTRCIYRLWNDGGDLLKTFDKRLNEKLKSFLKTPSRSSYKNTLKKVEKKIWKITENFTWLLCFSIEKYVWKFIRINVLYYVLLLHTNKRYFKCVSGECAFSFSDTDTETATRHCIMCSFLHEIGSSLIAPNVGGLISGKESGTDPRNRVISVWNMEGKVLSNRMKILIEWKRGRHKEWD